MFHIPILVGSKYLSVKRSSGRLLCGWLGIAAAGAAGAQELAWTPDGTRLLVERRWVLDPAREAWTELPRPFPEPELVAVSPSGRRLAAAGAGRLAAGPIEGPLGEPVPVPVWAPEEPSGPRREELDLELALFWLDEERLFVQQTERLARVEPQCRIWETGPEAWRPAPSCVAGDFYQVWAIERGPRGWIAVYTAGEGHPGMMLARYDADQGQRPLPEAPELDLYPFGPLRVQFRADGSGVLLATPCVLERKEPRPCEEPHGGWRVYSWAPGSGAPRLEREGLTEGALPSPDGQHLAWASGGRVCVSRPGAPEACLPLPGK